MALSSLRAVMRMRAPVTTGGYGRAAQYRRIQWDHPRSFGSTSYRFQASAPKETPKTESVEEKSDSSAQKESQADSAESSEQKASEDSQSTKEESEGKEESSEKPKEKDAAPPPHGDKTPWQVFTEQLKAGFEESKEWKDSTKALQSGYSEFTSNPALQKMTSAYSEASKTATSTTSAALKSTAKVVGKSATWAWETPVAKVVRKGATVAGDGIEKVTRPVRETEAYKSVKDVIDDGSSSRYGGWAEREERKARRAKRDAALGTLKLENLEEDPK
jgi:mitochondrial import inner membrane translocase subunit TIM44